MKSTTRGFGYFPTISVSCRDVHEDVGDLEDIMWRIVNLYCTYFRANLQSSVPPVFHTCSNTNRFLLAGTTGTSDEMLILMVAMVVME